MNSVLAYKQFELREGLAELLAPEIKNMNVFKASIEKIAQNFSNMFGYDKSYDRTYYDKDYDKSGHEKTQS